MKWEYLLMSFGDDTVKEREDRLDRRGMEDWELVSVSNGIAYLKRPKKEQT